MSDESTPSAGPLSRNFDVECTTLESWRKRNYTLFGGIISHGIRVRVALAGEVPKHLLHLDEIKYLSLKNFCSITEGYLFHVEDGESQKNDLRRIGSVLVLLQKEKQTY